jgi:hypothetical protein
MKKPPDEGAMHYTVQFLDDPGNIIEEWFADADDAHDVAAAIALTVHWPDGAVRMRRGRARGSRAG